MDERMEAVARMQSYIAQHIDELITPADYARAAGYSPWYAARLFKEYTGLTPADYLRRLRLSASAKRLKSGAVSVTDEAIALNFGSVDGYTRAFRREFGINPSEYMKSQVPLWLFNPYGVKFSGKRKAETMENVNTIFITKLEKPARSVILKRGRSAEDYWSYCEEVGCDVWGLLTSISSISGEPVCLWLPAGYILPDTSKYVQGVEVSTDYDGVIPEGFDRIELPAALYLSFQGEPFEEEAFGSAIAAVKRAMDEYDPSVLGLSWDDSSPRIQLEPIGTRGYIELRAVKEI